MVLVDIDRGEEISSEGCVTSKVTSGVKVSDRLRPGSSHNSHRDRLT